MFQTLKKISYKFDIFVIVIVLLTTVIECLHINKTFVNAGLTNSQPYKFLYLVVLYELLKIAILVCYLVIGFLLYLKRDKKLLRIAQIVSLSILLFIGSLILIFIFNRPGAVHFLKGFQQWVSRNVEIDAIQTWIQSDEAEQFLGHRYDKDDFPADLPDFISNINSDCLIFHDNDFELSKCVEFEWFTLGGSWGLVIGLPTMKVETEGKFPQGVSEIEFRRLIKPGVYIYSEG